MLIFKVILEIMQLGKSSRLKIGLMDIKKPQFPKVL